MEKNSLPQEAIGRYTTEAVPVADKENLVATVHKRIFDDVGTYETINYIYVVDKQKHLIGVVSIKELARAKEGQKIKDIMKKKLITARAHTHRVRAVYLALQNSLKALPIVSKTDKLLGVVPSDALLSILQKETHQTLLRQIGVIPSKGERIDDTLKMSILAAFKRRVVWIIVGLIGGILAARIVNGFEETLRANLILAAFVPLVVYLADAVGTQTQTLFVRDIAIKPALPVIEYTFKQLATTTLIGLLTGAAVWVIVLTGWQSSQVGIAVGLAVVAAIASSTLIALIIPFLLNKLKQDPANGSGPFATIIQDITSIIIYFFIASTLLG